MHISLFPGLYHIFTSFERHPLRFDNTVYYFLYLFSRQMPFCLPEVPSNLSISTLQDLSLASKGRVQAPFRQPVTCEAFESSAVKLPETVSTLPCPTFYGEAWLRVGIQLASNAY